MPHLFGEHSDVFIEGVGGADVSSGHAGLSGGAGGQLTLVKDQGEQREQRVAATHTHRPRSASTAYVCRR